MISHGSRSGSRSGTRSRCTSTPTPPRAISASDEASPAAPQSCSRDDEVALDEVERHLDQRLAAERVADLDRRPLLVRALEVLAREHRGAADPVAAGERAVEDEQVAGALSPSRASTRSVGQQADAHRVHERVRGVRLVEHASRRRRSGRRRSCRSGRCPRRRAGSASRARRSAARRGARSAARPSRRCRGGSRRRRSRRPGTARPPTGWLCDSTLNATATPSPRSITPAFSPGPCSTRSPLRRQPPQQRRRVLVAAVLRPEHARRPRARSRSGTGRAARGYGRTPRR